MHPSKALFSPTLTSTLSKTVYRGLASSTCTAPGLHGSTLLRPLTAAASRQFSTSRRSQLEFFQPPKNLPHIKLTPPSWPHPSVTEQQLKDIEVAHREVKTWSDWTAYNMVRILRWGTDLATGYRHDPDKPYVMSERKWLIRFIFLETVAGVPGMMGGMLRHFHSLRKMKRDNGW
jgi:Alternative oxidase